MLDKPHRKVGTPEVTPKRENTLYFHSLSKKKKKEYLAIEFSEYVSLNNNLLLLFCVQIQINS